MNILKEITDWEDGTPNHTYAINSGGKMVAFRRTGHVEWEIFSAPRMFDRRFRKFKTLAKDVGNEYFSKKHVQC